MTAPIVADALSDAELSLAIRDAAANWAPFTPRPDALRELLDVEARRRAARQADLHAVTEAVLSHEPTPSMAREIRPNRSVDTEATWSTIAVMWGGFSVRPDVRPGARRWNIARRRYAQRAQSHADGRRHRDSLVRRRGLVSTREAREVAPDLLDGHAYVLASHYVDADGIERRHELPPGARHNRACKRGESCRCGGAVVRIGAVAQAADARATERVSVQWHGGTGRIEDADAGAISDGTRSERHAGVALTSRDDGCNATITDADGTQRRVRLVHLRADGARWLHAVAGTTPPERLATLDEYAIVGHVEVDPQRRFTDRVVVVDVLVRQSDGTYSTATRMRGETTGDGYVSADARPAPGRPLPHTARLAPRPKDTRPPTAERRATKRASMSHTRLEQAKSAAVTAIHEGVISGRADATHVKLARAAAVVTLLSSWTAIGQSSRVLVVSYEPAD